MTISQHLLSGQATSMFNAFRLNHDESASEMPIQDQYLLWIDGVGAHMLCTAKRVTIGGPARDDDSADIPLLANLSRKHASIVRSGEGYYLESHGKATVAGHEVNDRAYLNDGCEIELGGSVELRFRLPTALSVSAVIEFVSDHRPATSVDGVVLMDENCLLGPGRENHVRCPEWDDSIVLIRRDDGMYCKSRSDVFVNGQAASGKQRLEAGDIVTGSDRRFRLEAVT